jgi:hypothetical protein
MATRNHAGMKKRVLAGVLWFFAVAYAWNFVASFLGVSEAPGILLGALAALLFAIDPAGRIWPDRQGSLAIDVSERATV